MLGVNSPRSDAKSGPMVLVGGPMVFREKLGGPMVLWTHGFFAEQNAAKIFKSDRVD